MISLAGKNIVLGVTGGIAAYKTCELVRSLVKENAAVQVVMTTNASRFVTPLTLQTLSNRKVATDMFDLTTESEIGHIKIADEADIIVIAPATASFIGKIASGIADSLPATVILASKAPVILCPAMNVNMYSNGLVQENIKKLKDHGFQIMEPEEGNLACGWEGKGRLPDIELIKLIIKKTLTKQDFHGKKILVTAGPTREKIDPARFISNPSTGKMGYEIARAGWIRGAEVTLISGISQLPPPHGVKLITTENSKDMFEKTEHYFKEADILIKSAAVSDYTPKKNSSQKIKKSDNSLTLQLKRTKDILKSVAKNKNGQIVVGFAAETENLVENAIKKIQEKKLDLVVANEIGKENAGFGSDTNIAYLIDKNGKTEELPLMTKEELSHRILDKVAKLNI